jgi:hypothetical protein
MQELFSPCGLCSNLTGIRSKGSRLAIFGGFRHRFQANARHAVSSGEIMRRLALYSAVLLCLGTTQALCLSDKPYLNASDADFGNLLPPPPADESNKRDMQGVLDLQKAVTPARLEQIQADVEQTVYRVAGAIFGPTTKDKFPLAGAFFDKVRDDSAAGVRDIKQKYKRLRPFPGQQGSADAGQHRTRIAKPDLSERALDLRGRSRAAPVDDGSGKDSRTPRPRLPVRRAAGREWRCLSVRLGDCPYRRDPHGGIDDAETRVQGRPSGRQNGDPQRPWIIAVTSDDQPTRIGDQ